MKKERKESQVYLKIDPSLVHATKIIHIFVFYSTFGSWHEKGNVWIVVSLLHTWQS